ncbi:PQQ-binding-like beta-propeller repeat protein [Haloarcula onubensis]|uniref:PQQ-like beta-propeller repeat protein n=1 Tax=Haloarcula onubensis TaxID=2950539 RepID=A0ABU2FJC8_9EURY|nr:PQQ-binding-like beta-propeller repeat protein [Halomicroarcula sp. S3CR25-11]MDS0280854.1 PQQ-like beta-propeller repeat protein [Halomicroarcula sp. S3CR25-11]
MPPRSRRALLRASALTLGGLLAGCSGDSGRSTPPSTEPPAATPEQFPPPEPTPGSPQNPEPMPTETEWTRLQADRGNTGHLSDVTAVTGEPDVYWAFYVSSSPPVVADGSLYMTESREGRTVVARDAATGELQWTTAVDGGATGMPCVSGETVLVQSYGHLSGFDRRSGDQLWQRSIGRGPPGCPVVVDDVAYLANGAFSEWSTEIFAYDVSTGTRQWRTTLETDELRLDGSVAVGDDYVFVVAGDIVAFDTTDGRETWRTELDAPAETTPTVTDDTVYVTDSGGTLHAVRTADGSERWTAVVGEPEPGTAAAIADGEVYVGTKSGLYSFTATGETRWEFDLAEATTPTVDTDAVYVGERGFRNRTVYAVARADGSELWRYTTDEKQVSDTIQAGVRGPPTPVEGGLYVVAADGIRAFGR